MIVLENVTRTYAMGDTIVKALRGVSLRIAEGEFVALIGASGSGKSTLLHIIGLLDRPDAGVLRLAGRDTATLPDDDLAQLRSETIGFVFQQFHLLKRLTARANVELPLIYAKGDRPSAEPAGLLARVGLEHRAAHRPNELSGGQQQRVAIARALVRRPRLVLADEPTGNLDSRSGADIMALLRELHAEGLTVVIVTHEPAVAAAADRVIRIHDGQVVEDVRREPAKIVTPPPPPLRPPTRPHPFLLNLQQAARGLWGNKLRTCLSALGIIIGVAAVIVMLALGHAAQSSVNRQIAALGTNRMIVLPNPQFTNGVRQKAGAVSRLTLEDAYDLMTGVPTVKAVTGAVTGGVQAVYGHRNINTVLNGEMPGYAAIYHSPPTYGRFFTDEECRARARVALLGTVALAGLFGTENPIGRTVEINHVPFTVIGVLPSIGSNGSQDLDDLIVVPVQTAMYRIFGKKYLDFIDVGATDDGVLQHTVGQVQKLTDRWPHIPAVTSHSYRVLSMEAAAATLSEVTNTLSVMLASVAAISLVVGGIGIMNIMLVSVTERTREIGLRKALGAQQREIQAQFLTEAVALCLAGGLLGIALGWIVTLIVGWFQGAWIEPTLVSVLLSCGFSVLIGVGFGYWPAVLASRLDPIEALRYE